MIMKALNVIVMKPMFSHKAIDEDLIFNLKYIISTGTSIHYSFPETNGCKCSFLLGLSDEQKNDIPTMEAFSRIFRKKYHCNGISGEFSQKHYFIEFSKYNFIFNYLVRS